MTGALPFLSAGTNLLQTGLQAATLKKQTNIDKQQRLKEIQDTQKEQAEHVYQAKRDMAEHKKRDRLQQGQEVVLMSGRGLALSDSIKSLLRQQQQDRQQQINALKKDQLATEQTYQKKRRYLINQHRQAAQLGNMRLGTQLLKGVSGLF